MTPTVCEARAAVVLLLRALDPECGQWPTHQQISARLDAYAAALRAEPAAEIAALKADGERLRALLNTPEIEDFARGVALEAAHQRQRWDDSRKTDFDWHAVAGYLAAKALLNPPQNDGTTGRAAQLHRLVALGALVANWHAAVLARPDASR